MSFWNKLFSNTSDSSVTLPPGRPATASTDLRCTMKLWKNGRIIPRPTDADVKAEVLALDDSVLGPRLVLGLNGNGSQIQLSGTPRDGFALDYRERDADEAGYFYASRRCDYSADTAIKILIAFRNGKVDWGTMVEWKKLRL